MRRERVQGRGIVGGAGDERASSGLGVRFAADFLPRVGRLVVRVAGSRVANEGDGRARMAGGGLEFVGYRPYRAGEDLRGLDWGLYARLHRPFVRVSRREASERWAVLLDTSRSMGTGSPAKIQRAAEVSASLAAVARREGASLTLATSGGEGLLLRPRSDLRSVLDFLEGASFSDARGLGGWVEEASRFSGAGAVFLVGDFLDLEPRDVLGLVRRGRDLACVQILAAEELAPGHLGAGGLEGPVRWVDPETGEALEVELDARTLAAYERQVGEQVERWGASCARHRIRFGSWSSAEPFENVVAAVFEA